MLGWCGIGPMLDVRWAGAQLVLDWCWIGPMLDVRWAGVGLMLG
ncbi:hypothetical protein [Paenibacillus tritici]|nr:hypothetical protein [Paenibacillus tritici]